MSGLAEEIAKSVTSPPLVLPPIAVNVGVPALILVERYISLYPTYIVLELSGASL